MTHSKFDNLIPANPIGNSWANPFIQSGKTYRNLAEAVNPNADGTSQQYYAFTGMLYDYSYLLNEVLFDSYFFSSLVTPSASGGSGQYAPRNPRMTAINAGTSITPDLDTSAAHLYIDGAFNINSTSVEAWKAVLSAFYGESVTRRSGTVDTHEERTPFLRTSVPVHGVVGDTAAGNSVEARSGYRALSDSQIDALALAIVSEIKARGPSTSLSAFINRKPSSELPEQQLAGTLTAAIASVSDINASVASGFGASLNSSISVYNLAAGSGATTEGLPGWLTSADILSRLGSVLSARSDTFIIRASGQYMNPLTGEVESTAYCEAVVQRQPEYVSSVNAPEVSPSDSGFDEINRLLGRRFQIVGFRWLSQSEL